MWFPSLVVLAHYHLGTAYEATGKKAKVIEQYETFLDICKEADTELDKMKEAKKLLAKLKA